MEISPNWNYLKIILPTSVSRFPLSDFFIPTKSVHRKKKFKILIWLWERERERDGANHCERKVGWDLVQKKFWSISQLLSFDESLPTEIWRNNQIEEKRILKFRNEESDGMRSVPFVDQGRRGAHPWYWVETRQRWFEQTLAASGSPSPAILLFSNPNYILNNLANNRPSLVFFNGFNFFLFLIFNF